MTDNLPVKDLAHQIVYNKSLSQSVKDVLPAHIKPEVFLGSVLSGFRKNTKLTECSQFSLLYAIKQCAFMGLIPNTPQGEAWILPYGKEAQLQIGYRGFVQLLRNSGQVLDIKSNVVFDKEEWEYEDGDNPSMKHKPLSPAKRGDAIGAYCIVYLANKSKRIEFMWAEEIEHAKSKSQSGNSSYSPWNDPFWKYEMWKKTVVKRACKTLPLSPALQKAVELEQVADSGIEYTVSDCPEDTLASNTQTRVNELKAEAQNEHI